MGTLSRKRRLSIRGDSIVVEENHRRAAAHIVPVLLPVISERGGRCALTVAGESGSGKSETAVAIADGLAEQGIGSVILQQDDYFVYPPKSNDLHRRQDISWVGPGEVHLGLLDLHLRAFLDGEPGIDKPLVDYESDSIGEEVLSFGDARVVIAEGTYTSLLDNADMHGFIARDFEQTRAHREKRARAAAELDPFIDEVLKIEHEIISAHRTRAGIVINPDYTVAVVF